MKNFPDQDKRTISTHVRQEHGFIERHGELMQVELDALPPDVLRGLYEDAVFQWFDMPAYDEVVAVENRHVAKLEEYRLASL